MAVAAREVPHVARAEIDDLALVLRIDGGDAAAAFEGAQRFASLGEAERIYTAEAASKDPMRWSLSLGSIGGTVIRIQSFCSSSGSARSTIARAAQPPPGKAPRSSCS